MEEARQRAPRFFFCVSTTLFMILVAMAVSGTACTPSGNAPPVVGGDQVVDGVDDGNGAGDDGSGAGDQSDGGDFPPSFLGAPGEATVFFSDIISGPDQGGENDEGAYVTLFGNGFGAEQGSSTVTLGGSPVGVYPLWSQGKITFQVPRGATSGDIVVHTANGESNGLAFTVQSGHIFFVANNGRDDASGSFDDPWRTLPHAVEAIGPGDIVYALDGVSATSEHLNEAALSIEAEGTVDGPIALLAYPRAVVTVGDPQDLQYGLRVAPPIGVHASYWVIGGIRFRGRTSAMELGGDGAVGWRIVGNDISCPDGDGQTGCFAASFATYARFLGNEVHDTGVQGASKQYHAVYFTTDSNHIEVGWNHIHDNRTCRALQFHSSPLCLPDCGPTDTTGFNQFDLIVHDNLIHGDACDGINFATVDPSRGPVEAFNNIIYEVGRGPDPPDGLANYAGISVPGYLNNGPEGTGTVEAYNNTLYDCGSVGGPTAGAITRTNYSSGLVIRIRNNIIVQPTGILYFTEETDAALVEGQNNLWFGAGAGPLTLTANINADPGFHDAGLFDFSLTADSPAVDAGAEIGAAWDITGASRPRGSGIDLGAFEFHDD